MTMNGLELYLLVLVFYGLGFFDPIVDWFTP